MPSILVIGGTGYIGSHVVETLLKDHKHHQVTVLVRDPQKAHGLEARGAKLEKGDLHALNPEHLANFDVVVCAAADMAAMAEGEAKQANALIAAGEIAKKRGKHFSGILTTGCLAVGESADPAVKLDDYALNPPPAMAWRVENEKKVLAASPHNAVIRPGFVWGGSASHGYNWYQAIKKTGALSVIGQPSGRFPWVHVQDLAEQYVIVIDALLAKNPAASGPYSGVDGRPSLTHEEVQTAFAHELGAKVEHITVEQGEKFMGFFARMLVMQMGHLVPDHLTKIGWKGPKHPTPIAGVKQWVADVKAGGDQGAKPHH